MYKKIHQAKTLLLVLALVLIGIYASGCSSKDLNKGEKIDLTSPAFTEGGTIPVKYTRVAGGSNVSPELNWASAPQGTVSFALICDDPDAPMGTFVHWVIYNIPAAARALPEGLPQEVQLADGTQQGQNNFENIGYDGPEPPGGTHRYYFKLYALDKKLELRGQVGKSELESTMKGHVIGWGQLMGKFTRP